MPNTEVKKAAVKNGKEEVGANDEPSGDDDDEKREWSKTQEVGLHEKDRRRIEIE